MHVRIVETKDFTKGQWKRYYEFRRHLAQYPWSPLESANWWILKRRTIREAKALTDYRCAGLEGRKGFCGYMILNRIGKDAPGAHVRWVFDASRDELPEVLMRRLARWILSRYSIDTCVILNSYEKRNDTLARTLGGRIAARRHYVTLQVRDVRRSLMGTWVSEGRRRNHDLHLGIFESIPERYPEEYCALFTRLLREMPRGSAACLPVITPERTRKQERMNRKNDSVAYSAILFNAQGRIVGHTNVFIRRKNPRVAYQFMTGVAKEYRGRGLGRWMKAAMFKRLLRDFPQLQEMKTDTNPRNKWMLAINDQIGYRYSHSLKEFKIREKGLRAVLKR